MLGQEKMEKLKERTKAMMIEYKKFPRAELINDQHDEAVDKALREQGYKGPIPNGSFHGRVRKIVIAGYAPMPLSPGDLAEMSAALPRKPQHVLAQKKKGVRKMKPIEKAVVLKHGKSKKSANNRNNLRAKNPSIPVGLPPPPKEFYETVGKLVPMMTAAGLSHFRVIRNDDGMVDIEFEVRRTYRHPIGRA
jgi:hypothetical protein